MYATDAEYERTIQKNAREVIARIERRSTSKKYRIRELDYMRRLYKSLGLWQAAMDLVEEQMVIWGRVEHEEHAALVAHYHEEIRKHTVPSTKGEWDEADLRTLGLSLAYAEARYAFRFHSRVDAIAHLEARIQEIMEWQKEFQERERLRVLTEAECLREIISQFQQ